MLWLGGVVLAVSAAVVILLYVRRRMRGTQPWDYRGFTLEDIRVMHERGDLTGKEYELLRRSAAGLGLPPERPNE